ncbi:myotubularin-related protein 9-like isoform X1 [Canis lupus familiaris]|uniref:myotubularin-related protein 9-like isoform X1 n=1 Tax=Canis lupus familiaris TaxID=9615 RepID=UPI0018F2F761|nr:myotubularin-related protein 9-like isoform X1 [Canis lupus familiaris]XP_038387172.1 myotubularin-related protein 9-like isoform X1 [Canis lupus familiaris]XP_038387173.1 myotubularin-related protein 9-like isoform X1 [Canis lupus familiaris]XP_038515477.1 myotubularin-related protein 9-like isoform X1 [Canis lupus familiaris]XP_038515478.1 myotubularin-related protein 9-like isoform X1 [Canis lupus familiaris]XP_038515479.1 myotubularin-related protein 9-like isoform X1 [Canis lupus famil
MEALSSLESVITSFPFFYRPKGLRLGDAWHFHPPERYERVAREVGAVARACGRARVAAPARGVRPRRSLTALTWPSPFPARQTNAWRLSEVNENFSLCPSYPRAVIVARAVKDRALALSSRFRRGGRCPVLSHHRAPANRGPTHPDSATKTNCGPSRPFPARPGQFVARLQPGLLPFLADPQPPSNGPRPCALPSPRPRPSAGLPSLARLGPRPRPVGSLERSRVPQPWTHPRSTLRVAFPPATPHSSWAPRLASSAARVL